MPLDCIKQTIRKNRQLSVPILIQISHIFKTIITTEAVGLMCENARQWDS